MYSGEPGLLLGVIPTKQIGDGLISLVYNFPLFYEVTLMNIQGGLSRDYKRKCMGRFIIQNC